MEYISTRGAGGERTTAGRAILQGISEDGGLFVPEHIPRFCEEELSVERDYCALAAWVLGKFITDFTPEQIEKCVRSAYTGGRFENDLPAVISKVGDSSYLLELWHGPTCAFKDLALQLLPRLMALSAETYGKGEETVVLVATSGDTGKAALEGFADAPGTRVIVFYPRDGVSEMQKLQMRAQSGSNVSVCAVEGNFDDAQTGVKRIFTDGALRMSLESRGMRFSSANSINWGRLAPQIVYYAGAYCDLVRDEEIALGETVNVVVPTGNFGNILAAYYAKRMGLPIGKLICASNRNNVLSDFIHNGVYDLRRDFYPSLSPSMDILISSNLERLLFEISGRDASCVGGLMESLASTGRYRIDGGMLARLQEDFAAGFCDDEATKASIRAAFEEYGYLLDTHTAVAWNVYERYRRETGDDRRTIVVSTASPYKFAGSVCRSLDIDFPQGLFAPLDALSRATGTPVPNPLEKLRSAKPRFDDVCGRDHLGGYVREQLGLQRRES